MPTIQEIRQKYPQYSDLSDDQLASSLHKKFYSDMPEEEFKQKVGIAAPGPKPIGERIAEHAAKREAMRQDIVSARERGEQGYLESGFQQAGKVGAGFVNDVAGEALKSAGYGISSLIRDEYEQPLKQAAGHVFSAISDSPAGDLARSTIQRYQGFAEEHPRAARNIEAATNLGSVVGPVTPVKGKTLAGTALDTVEQGAKSTASTALTVGNKTIQLADEAKNKLATKLEPKPVAISGDVFGEARKAYEAVDGAGATLMPRAVNAFVNDAVKTGTPNGVVKDVFGKDELSQILYGNGADSVGISGLLNRPLTIQDAHALDKKLTHSINKHYRDGLDEIGGKLLDIQQSLRKNLMSPDPKNVSGGVAGFEAWKEANRLWSKASKIEAIEDILSNAKLTDNPASSIKTGFRNLLKNDKKMRGLEEYRDLIEHAANTGIGTDLLRSIGGRLGTQVGTGIGALGGAGAGPIGVGLGAVAGGVVSHGLTSGARAAAAKLQANRAKKVLYALGEDSQFRPYVDPPKAPEPMKYLPAPEKPYIAGPDGLRQATDAEFESATKARQLSEALGLTPDVLKAQELRQASQVSEMRQRMFEEALKQREALKATELEQLWTKRPDVAQLIEQAKSEGLDVSNFTGSDPTDTALGQALLRARRTRK